MSAPAAISGHILLRCALLVSFCAACPAEPSEPLGREAGGLFATKTGVHTRLKTKLGDLEGRLQRQTRAFLGIPYAKAPAGLLRFAPPEAAGPWSGIRDATKFGPICPQPHVGPFALDHPMDEDCLTLNVYTPDPPSNELLPVMIYLHGGGFAFGSSRDHEPPRLSEAGPVVVVTLQYRLSALGFFTHPALDAVRGGTPSGNDGLRDQQLAFQWVKDNIADYAGDPTNITLFGESTGSTSVCFQLVSPGSRGIAKRAIMQSNECAIINRAVPREEADVLGQKLADAFCPDLTDAALIDCLRACDARELAAFGSEIPGMPNMLKNTYGNPGWKAVVDGAAGILPESAADLFALGDFERLPLVIGSTRRESALWRSLNVEPNTFSSAAQLDAHLAGSFGSQLASEVSAVYRSGTDEDPNETYDRIASDIQVRCPTRALARTLSQHGSEVYLYSFEQGEALHGDDLKALFATVGPLRAHGAPPLTAVMKHFWTQFARDGDPNGPDTPTWPRYTPDTDAHMILDAQSTAGSGLAKDECDLWDRVAQERGTWIW